MKDFNFQQFLDESPEDEIIKDPIEERDDEIIDDEPQDKDDKKKDEDDNPLNAYYNFLVENQLLLPDEEDEFDGKEETLTLLKEKTFNKQRNEAIKDFYSQLPEKAQSVVRNALLGLEDDDSDIDVLSLEVGSEANQKRILKELYKKTTRLSDEKIERVISKLEKEELESEALEALDSLKELKQTEIEKAAKLKAEKEREEKERQEEIRVKMSKAVEDITSDASRAKKLKALIFNPIKRDDGVSTEYIHRMKKIQQNEKHLAQLADILLDYDEKEGFKFDRFIKQGSNQTVKTLKERLSEGTKPKKNNDFWESFLGM